MKPKRVPLLRIRVDLGVMTMNEYSTILRILELGLCLQMSYLGNFKFRQRRVYCRVTYAIR